jgi:hypothetical protein
MLLVELNIFMDYSARLIFDLPWASGPDKN